MIKLRARVHTETKIYRDIKRMDYSAYVAGFFANKGNYQAGAMYELKGKKEILRHTFGANHTAITA